MGDIAKYVFWILFLILVLMTGLYVECRLDGGAVYECTTPFRNLGEFIRSLLPWSRKDGV